MGMNVEKNIKYLGDQAIKKNALAFVDEVLKEKERLNERTDLSGGLMGLATSFLVHIMDDDDSYDVKLVPFDEKQQGVEFVIHKKTRTIYQSVGDQDPVNPEDENMDFLDDMS